MINMNVNKFDQEVINTVKAKLDSLEEGDSYILLHHDCVNTNVSGEYTPRALFHFALSILDRDNDVEEEVLEYLRKKYA